jgi:hypothetical protein
MGRNLAFLGVTGIIYTVVLCVVSVPRKGTSRYVPNVNKDLEDEDVR